MPAVRRSPRASAAATARRAQARRWGADTPTQPPQSAVALPRAAAPVTPTATSPSLPSSKQQQEPALPQANNGPSAAPATQSRATAPLSLRFADARLERRLRVQGIHHGLPALLAVCVTALALRLINIVPGVVLGMGPQVPGSPAAAATAVPPVERQASSGYSGGDRGAGSGSSSSFLHTATAAACIAVPLATLPALAWVWRSHRQRRSHATVVRVFDTALVAHAVVEAVCLGAAAAAAAGGGGGGGGPAGWGAPVETSLPPLLLALGCSAGLTGLPWLLHVLASGAGVAAFAFTLWWRPASGGGGGGDGDCAATVAGAAALAVAWAASRVADTRRRAEFLARERLHAFDAAMDRATSALQQQEVEGGGGGGGCDAQQQQQQQQPECHQACGGCGGGAGSGDRGCQSPSSCGVAQHLALASATDAALARAEEVIDLYAQAEARQSFFLATMSHELRTPLTSLLGCAELLGSASLDEESREMASLIQASGGYLLTIVNDVLDFSKLTSSAMQFQLDAVDFDPRQLAERVLATFVPQAQSKRVRLHVDMGTLPAGLRVRGDCTRVEQIAVNFLSNAIKFTPAGGDVTLRLTARRGNTSDDVASSSCSGLNSCSSFGGGNGLFQPSPLTSPSASLPWSPSDAAAVGESYGFGLGREEAAAAAVSPPSRTGAEARLPASRTVVLSVAVSDTGIGMDAKARQRLFKPFSQGGTDVNRRFGGTGLGLCICAQLAAQMGCPQIAVDSAPDHGTTMRADLCLGEVPVDATAAVATPLLATHPNQQQQQQQQRRQHRRRRSSSKGLRIDTGVAKAGARAAAPAADKVGTDDCGGTGGTGGTGGSNRSGSLPFVKFTKASLDLHAGVVGAPSPSRATPTPTPGSQRSPSWPPWTASAQQEQQLLPKRRRQRRLGVDCAQSRQDDGVPVRFPPPALGSLVLGATPNNSSGDGSELLATAAAAHTDTARRRTTPPPAATATTAADVDTADASPPQPLAGKHILLVDDVRTIRLVGSRLLERAGATVSTAADGRLAVAAVAGAAAGAGPPIDCVLMDLHMPNMDGLEASREIRRLFGADAPPVVGSSADVMDAAADAFRAAGARGIVAKPFNVGEIVRVVRRTGTALPEPGFVRQ